MEQSDIVRQELTVLPADCPKEEIGWIFKETIGIGVVHEYYCLPWYKKIFRKKFWRDISYKILRRKSKFVQYEEDIMGWDHRISCKECKETVCIARNKKLYRDDESLDKLQAFLNKHADHELIFAADDDYPRVDDCTQFEIEYELESCPKCLQMTNHLNGVCLKCRSKEKKHA